MRQSDLPQRWQINLRNHLKQNGSKYENPSAGDFLYNLKIGFPDGSNAFFKYAFYLIDEKIKEVAVFTEHCGYHIFYLPDILLETIDWETNITKIQDFKTEY